MSPRRLKVGRWLLVLALLAAFGYAGRHDADDLTAEVDRVQVVGWMQGQ